MFNEVFEQCIFGNILNVYIYGGDNVFSVNGFQFVLIQDWFPVTIADLSSELLSINAFLGLNSTQ